MKFEELTTTDVQQYLETQNAVLIPLGSIEQHGAHLPLGTDSFLTGTIVDQVSDLTNIPMLPPINCGPCFNSSSHAGTVSISTHVFYDLLQGILTSLYSQGFRTFFLLSGNAGQSQLVTLRELAENFMQSKEDARFHVICTYHVSKAVAQTLVDASREFHAGAVETSLMLYLRPDLVDSSKYKPGKKKFPQYEIVRDKKKYWETGVDGRPAAASEALGREIFEKTVAHIKSYVAKHSS
ncbi:MAG: creatininase family protein [bacterium]|nr:creatininase family protein [bacterium]